MDFVQTVRDLLPEPWILIAIAGSFAFASMNFIDEWLLDRLNINNEAEEGEQTAVGSMVIISGLFGLVVASVIGLSSFFLPPSVGSIWVPKGLIGQALVVGMLEVTWLIPYLYATNHHDDETDHGGAIAAAPLFQTIPIFGLVLGLIFFGEVPPLMQIIGSFIIVGGAILLNLMPGTFRLNKRVVLLMLLASSIVALIYFLFKGAASEGNFIATAFWGGIGMSISSVLIWSFYPPFRRQFNHVMKHASKGDLAFNFINEVVDKGATLAFQLAVLIGPSVMAVSAMNAYQPVFILLIGLVLAKFGSKAHAKQLQGTELVKKAIAIAFIAGGTVLIAH